MAFKKINKLSLFESQCLTDSKKHVFNHTVTILVSKKKNNNKKHFRPEQHFFSFFEGKRTANSPSKMSPESNLEKVTIRALKNKRDYRNSDGLTASSHVRFNCQTLTSVKTQQAAAAQGMIISLIIGSD